MCLPAGCGKNEAITLRASEVPRSNGWVFREKDARVMRVSAEIEAIRFSLGNVLPYLGAS